MKSILFALFALTFVLSATAQEEDTLKGHTSDTTIYISVEHEPEFPGGTNTFLIYFAKNFKYPATVRSQNIQGRMIVSMVVEKNGSISNVKVAGSISDDIEKEVVKVFHQSPKWKPGIRHGKSVRTFYRLPISCMLPVE